MGIYGEKKDYEELVRENIEKANLLHDLNDEGKAIIEKLLEERSNIRNKNGLFASCKINRINKKIEKIKEKYKNKQESN